MAKKIKVPPGTWVQRDLFESKAFLSLGGVAPQILIIFLGKRKFERQGRKGKEKLVCININEIVFTYLEAEKKYGITHQTFSRSITQLLERGFIVVQHRGGAFKKDKTVYGLSDQWMIWKKGLKINARPKDVSRGFRQHGKAN